MSSRKTLVAAIIMLVGTVALTYGCGKAKPDLSYDRSGGKPVITCSRFQAISPAYNPDSPAALIYGDGTVIKKKGPYKYVSGKITEDGLKGGLDTLAEQGFFNLNKEYSSKKPLPGGVTETLDVKLKDGDHRVTTFAGAGPSNWSDMVETVTDVETTGTKEYIPDTVLLFAREKEGGGEVGKTAPWLWGEGELAGAAAAPNGLKLTGEDARKAWKAVQEVDKEETYIDIYWTAGGKVYSDVYTRPVFPGVSSNVGVEK